MPAVLLHASKAILLHKLPTDSQLATAKDRITITTFDKDTLPHDTQKKRSASAVLFFLGRAGAGP